MLMFSPRSSRGIWLVLAVSIAFISTAKSVHAQDAPGQNFSGASPVALTGGPYAGSAGQTIAFDGGGSWSYDGSIIYYYWDFGDGTAATGPTPNHNYNSDGLYSVALFVCDENWNCASTDGFVTIDSVNFPVRINFDTLPDGTAIPNNTVIADQYLSATGVRFSSDNPFSPVHTWQNCGFCSTTSPPNFVWTAPNITGQTIVDFTQPASNLVFNIVGIDVFFDQFAVIDVYRNNSFYGSLPVFGNGTATRSLSFGALDNINRIVIRSITDPSGVGFDDFSFTVPADVKITNGRINGYLNGTTQNALLGADVALNASPLPGAFSGGTYSWSCMPTSTCQIVTGNSSSSVTVRTNELSNVVGNYTVTINYTKGQVSTSSLMTITSVLPSVTSFVGTESTDRINASGGNPLHPGPCEDIFGFWRYQLGCGHADEGISFDARVHANTFISDPTKSGIKYVQAVSSYRQVMQSGNLLCNTKRSDPSNIDSGWQLDDADPYVFDCCPVHYFSEGNDVSMHSHDYPGLGLTRVTDYEMIDAVYIDDRFQTYLVYFTNTTPSIQRPLAKLPWNWGGEVFLKWDPAAQTTQHRIISTSTVPGTKNSVVANSIVPMQGRVQDNPNVACQQGVSLTHNLIDSTRVFVRFHYKDFLNRDPAGSNPNDSDDFTGTDLPGWKYWTSQISQCVFDLGCIRAQRINDGLAFFLSAEFIQTDPNLSNPPGSPGFIPEVYNRAFVRHCYIAYLHKEPDPDGWDYWTNNLNSNGDYHHMIDAFQVCDDYRNNRSDFTTSAEKF